MSAEFTYKGIPIRDESGNIIAVHPVKGIEADNGKTYSGVLSIDGSGNSFTYNKVPNDYLPTPIETLFFLNTPPRLPDTRYVILSNGVIEPDKIIMA